MKNLKKCFDVVDEFSMYLEANGTKQISYVIVMLWKKIVRCAFRRYHSMEYFPWYFIEKFRKRLQNIKKIQIWSTCWKTHWKSSLILIHCWIAKKLFQWIENHFENINLLKTDFQLFQTLRNRYSQPFFGINKNWLRNSTGNHSRRKIVYDRVSEY